MHNALARDWLLLILHQGRLCELGGVVFPIHRVGQGCTGWSPEAPVMVLGSEKATAAVVKRGW